MLISYKELPNPSKNLQKALFLDRDGVVNEDFGYVHAIEDTVFCEGIFEVAKIAAHHKALIIIVTNQSGIGRGFYHDDTFVLLSEWMKAVFLTQGVEVTAVYYCPHHPADRCCCRKPSPNLILQACEDYNIDVTQSIMVGDKISDLSAGLNAGIGLNIGFKLKQPFDFLQTNIVFSNCHYQTTSQVNNFFAQLIEDGNLCD